MKNGRKTQRSPLGRPEWLDGDAAELLEGYAAHRLRSSPRPMASYVRNEVATLRGLYKTAQGHGAEPDILQLFRRHSNLVVRVLLGDPPRSNGRLLGMRLAANRFLEYAFNAEEAAAIREGIAGRLRHRPLSRLSDPFAPRTVGGIRKIAQPRPILVLADIESIIATAGDTLAGESYANRNRALLALLSFSGLTLPEVVKVRLDNLQLLDSTADPWCAFVHGVSRGRRACSIPIHARAWPFLDALFEQANSSRSAWTGSPFRSGPNAKRALSYTHAARIVRAVLQASGLPGNGRVVFQRAYVSFLKQEGVNDYEIRDAIGALHMETVDKLLQMSRGRAAQAIAAEHRVLEPLPAIAAVDAPVQQAFLIAEEPHDRAEARRILGVDPAYRRTGWAVVRCIGENVEVEAAGTIDTKRKPRAESLLQIDREFREIVRRTKPDRVLLEAAGRWVHKRSSSRHTIEVLAMARAIMFRVCASEGATADKVDVGQVRQFLTGRANGTKNDVARSLQALGLKVPASRSGKADPDIADAVAVALWGLQDRAEKSLQ